MYNICGLLLCASVKHQYPETGHDSFPGNTFQFTVRMELHLTHNMPCHVFMIVPK